MPGSSGSLLLLERGKASGMVFNANGMTSLRKDVRRRDVCFKQS